MLLVLSDGAMIMVSSPDTSIGCEGCHSHTAVRENRSSAWRDDSRGLMLTAPLFRRLILWLRSDTGGKSTTKPPAGPRDKCVGSPFAQGVATPRPRSIPELSLILPQKSSDQVILPSLSLSLSSFPFSSILHPLAVTRPFTLTGLYSVEYLLESSLRDQALVHYTPTFEPSNPEESEKRIACLVCADDAEIYDHAMTYPVLLSNIN